MVRVVRIGRIAAIFSLFAAVLAGASPSAGATKATGADNGTYTAPDFAVTLSYDADLWTVDNDVSAKENNGRDELRLINRDTDAVLYLETYDGYNGKAADCIDGAVSEVTGDAKTTPIEDRRGNKIAGSKKGVTWAAYSYIDSDGAEQATYVECRALPKAAGVFVASLITTVANFSSDYLDVQDILDTVDLGTAQTGSTGKTDSGKTGSGTDKTPTPTAGGGTSTDNGNATQIGDYLSVEIGDGFSVEPFGADSLSEGGAHLTNISRLTTVSLFTVSPERGGGDVATILDAYAEISGSQLKNFAPAQYQDGTPAREIKDGSGYAYYLFDDLMATSVLYVQVNIHERRAWRRVRGGCATIAVRSNIFRGAATDA